jgi:hypothetical protein
MQFDTQNKITFVPPLKQGGKMSVKPSYILLKRKGRHLKLQFNFILEPVKVLR